MPTPRQNAIKKLAADNRPLPAGELFSTRFYQPEDGPGVARLFYAVYGDGYPIDTFYLPEQLTEENRAGRIRSAVAVTGSGDVVSHEALYRSSAPNPGLFEFGLGLTLPSYRGTLAFARCSQLLMTLPGSEGIDAFFGEAVCNHTTTQKLTRQAGAVEMALEPALMPARAYETEQSAQGRVSCLMAFKVVQDHQRQLCIPESYRKQITFLLEGCTLDRELITSDISLPSSPAILESALFPEASVARCNITAGGDDLADRLRALESDLRDKQYALLQCFVPLDRSWAGPVVDLMRQERFFLGGFLPVWFGGDGLLMQKLFVDPGFEEMQLHSERSGSIRELVQDDWKRTQHGGG